MKRRRLDQKASQWRREESKKAEASGEQELPSTGSGVPMEPAESLAYQPALDPRKLDHDTEAEIEQRSSLPSQAGANLQHHSPADSVGLDASANLQDKESLAESDRSLLANFSGAESLIRQLGAQQIRPRLRRLREQVEPVLEAKLSKHQTLSQKLELLLRGGRPRPFALVGASGTGKSFRALLFAEHHSIPYLIDDGILIQGGRIVAGHSAKNETVYIRAIKTALFDDAAHLQEVRSAISQRKVTRILLVGTSVKMVRLIAKRLGLPSIAINDITDIQEISSPEDIEKAKKSRHAGHHIIPVPAVEVSRRYASLIRDGFQVFLSDLRMGMKHYLKKKARPAGQRVFEKTVVKPEFMKRTLEDSDKKKTGRVQVAEGALKQMIVHCIEEYCQEIDVSHVKIRISRTSYKAQAYVIMPLSLTKAEGKELSHLLYKLQNYVINSLHRYAGVLLEQFDIEVIEFV